MRKYLLYITLFTVLLLDSVSILAQQQAQYSLYKFNPLIYNSAYAGTKGTISGDITHRSQWAGMKGAPNTQSLTFHMPFEEMNMGAGLSVFHDRIGSTNTTAITGDYSYQMRINSDKDKLSFGLKAGVDLYSSNFLELDVIDPNDQIYLTNISSKALPNMGFGALYFNEDYFVGFSAQRLLEAKITRQMGAESSVLARHFYLMGGYSFELNEKVNIQPHTQMKFTMNAPVSIDVNVDMIYEKKIMVGLLYRSLEGVGLNMMVRFADYYRFGYGFNYSTTALSKYNGGSHEVMIGIDLNKSKSDTKSASFF